MPREPRDRPWVVVFILLSLLAHLLFVVAIVLVGHFFPPAKMAVPPPPPAEVSLTLQPPPPPLQPPPPKHIFMHTEPDATAKPHPSLVESDNDSTLHSHSTIARLPDSFLPDIVNAHKHPDALNDSPNAPSTTPPKPAAKNPGKSQKNQQGKQDQVAKTPPPPKAQKATQPSQSEAVNPTPNPVKQPAKPVQFNPNGLPVLPALNAAPMAPASESETPQTVQSLPALAPDSHGALGTHGINSPDAMATEFGKYKAKVYRAVGSRWYPKVDNQFQVLPVGLVHIQFTIHDDGSVETKVLEGDDASLQLLLSISLNSIRESAPFDPFTPSLRKEIAREEHNDGRSYTDDFSFSIYGN